MIHFLDGPADGVMLDLQRAPLMLRAVLSTKGEWDALDQPDDEAAPDEVIAVYRMVGKPTQVHVCCSPRSKSGSRLMADYRLLPAQPADEHVRTTKAWAAWCEANKEQLLAEARA